MRVFISYSHRDRSRATGLAAVLAHTGHEPWIDRELRSGQRFPDALARQIAAADCVVVLWTKDSVRSQWVLDEAELGRSKLRPVRFRVSPPLGFGRLHTPDLPLLSTADQIAAAVGLIEQPTSTPSTLARWI